MTEDQLRAHYARLGMATPPAHTAPRKPRRHLAAELPVLPSALGGRAALEALPALEAHASGSARMNKLEARYWTEIVQPLVRSGEVADAGFGRLSLRISQRGWYRPDFDLWLPDGSLILDETKGYMQEDALVKLKAIAALYPRVRVRVARHDRRVGWTVQIILR